MYVDIWHIILRSIVPIVQIMCHVIFVAIGRRSVKPKGGGVVHIETIKPDTGAAEQSSSVMLVPGD